eukprot:CAMPEP_0198316626 /NCGR_PEP_ID=MMETSP1450-20131203/6450_1 /TAXON_ID=753684 ORGANISM="Madagascaria erythrocladiodes, Strain CCMP3234" /NCGR_SAMPLE_ID=MMETSP1450 /ASSEMBLY_ACC=CAM_ASM_001115 /LENGTH=94 /DNA_ID=CAMNT_0044019793 /DNA_START=31 /DNA_END=312 /DNA_ORIENTATION=+
MMFFATLAGLAAVATVAAATPATAAIAPVPINVNVTVGDVARRWLVDGAPSAELAAWLDAPTLLASATDAAIRVTWWAAADAAPVRGVRISRTR